MIDLHLHTTASDGRSTPRELVAHAVAGRVSVMAVTDHDTTAACAEVLAEARERGIEAITGIEITAVENQRDLHVLGYFVDPEDESLAAFLASQRARPDRARSKPWVRGWPSLACRSTSRAIVSRADTSAGRSLGRPQLARAMVDAGYVADTREAFDRWLIEGTPGFVPRTGASVEAVIEIIHRAGRSRVDRAPGQDAYRRTGSRR